MLEFPPDRYSDGDGISELSVGDEIVLTISSYQERTSVACAVVRIDGRRCGVRFSGQFRNHVLRPKKSLKAKVIDPKAKPVVKPATKVMAKSGR